jgi:cytochrome c biogenesis protein
MEASALSKPNPMERRDTAAHSMTNVFRSLWKTLNSTRFVIILLILLALASIFGVFLNEKLPVGFPGAEEHYRAEFGDRTFELLVTLGAFRPFGSFWFQSLLFVLAASLIACSVTRLKVTVRAALAMTLRRSANEVMTLTPHARIPMPQTAGGSPRGSDVSAAIADTLRKKRFKVKSEPVKDGVALAGSRGSIVHAGPYLTHLGLLCLIAGGVVAGIGGRSEDVVLAPGEAWSGMGGHFAVRLVDFEIPRNTKGETMQYVSQLAVEDPERGGFSQTVSVNHPLRHRGVSLYQSSYQLTPHRLEQVILAAGPDGEEVTLAFAEKRTLADGRTIAVEDFVPDFRMTSGGVETASLQMRNPAIQVAVYQGEEKVESSWLFLNHPDFRHNESLVADIQIKGIEPLYSTGLVASTNPGAPLIWAGFVLATLGLILSFYLVHHRVWVVVGSDAVYVGGASSGRRDAFRHEFAAIERALAAIVPGKAVA